MRQHEDEVFVERIDKPKRDLVLVVFSIHGVVRKILQRVMHPPHVPLECEAQPSCVRRFRDTGPGGRFFGNRDRPGVFLMHQHIQFLEERDRL